MSQHVKIFDPASLPPSMVGCDESIAQTSQSHGSYMEVSPFGHHMLRTSWAQMEICPAVVDCDQMPQEVFYEDDDLIVTTRTLMMNAWRFLRMKVNKIEGPLTHAVNALINMV